MKIELRAGGKIIAIEAEGAVSVQISGEGAAALAALKEAVQALPQAWPAEGTAQASPQAWPAGGTAQALSQAWPVEETAQAPSQAWPADGTAQASPQAWPADGTAQAAHAPGAGAGAGLFSRLAGLRTELALAGGVPPYVVFKDSTLHEMAEKLPQDYEAFSRISGVGKAKLEKYGDIFIEAIREGVAA